MSPPAGRDCVPSRPAISHPNITNATTHPHYGYYRHSRFTAQTFKCRHPKACAGTADPSSDKVEDLRLEGDELCRTGFTGNRIGANTPRAV